MNNAAIDSCSIFIPLANLTEYSDSLTATIADIDLDTGEISNPRNNADIKVENVGYNTYYKRIQKQVNKEVITGIQISVNSKQLKQNYLTGITNNTLATLHNSIISEGVINCSFNNFVNALVQDVDVKLDITLDNNVTFNEFTNQLKQTANTNATGKLNLVKRYASDNNQGIEFGTRTTSNKLPHFKIYNKQIELTNNSLEFKQAYNINVVNPVRLEVNFKNRLMLVKYKLLTNKQNSTLQNIVNNLGNFNMKDVINIYVNTDNAKQVKQLKVNEAYEQCKDTLKIAGVVKLCVLLEYDLAKTIDEVVSIHMPNKNKLAMYKEITTNLYYDTFKASTLPNTNDVDRVLNMLKW